MSSISPPTLFGFDAMKYIASYGDLILAFGTNTTAATQHYLAYGYDEGRTVNFNDKEYVAGYSDLQVAFATNTALATQHFITNGYLELRSADLLAYTASYGDLISVFGTNTAAAGQHYRNNFFTNEHRVTSFDAEFYLAKNDDLRAVFGTDTVAATKHYIQAGYYEGRIASNVGNDVLTGSAGNDRLNAGAGTDILYGNNGADVLIGGDGSDTLIGGRNGDTYVLSETTAVTDTVQIAVGDSLSTQSYNGVTPSVEFTYDQVKNFQLGNGVFDYNLQLGWTPNTSAVDKLDLANTTIAANAVAVDGLNVGIGVDAIMSHSINNGIISFDDVDSYSAPVTITATNFNNVINYLNTNMYGATTVAFVDQGDTFVFQDSWPVDTLVDLVGVSATSLNNTGIGVGAVWIT